MRERDEGEEREQRRSGGCVEDRDDRDASPISADWGRVSVWQVCNMLYCVYLHIQTHDGDCAAILSISKELCCAAYYRLEDLKTDSKCTSILSIP